MKSKKSVFLIISALSLSSFYFIIKKENCLFYDNGKCITCETENDFWVGLPENCTLCGNRTPQYEEYQSLAAWICQKKETEDVLPPVSSNLTCPKEAPLRDILGHCYPCETNQPVQIKGVNEHPCKGKRYLTEFRFTEKSHKCPSIGNITNPEVCLNCQGFWYQEKCHLSKSSSLAFCQSNSNCSNNEYCYPFMRSYQGKTGICRPQKSNQWICSDLEGYNFESAQLFCIRQQAHIPNLKTLYEEKENVLKACSKNNIWIFFDEGSLYLDSLKEKYPITNEALTGSIGGDNFYALCQKD